MMSPLSFQCSLPLGLGPRPSTDAGHGPRLHQRHHVNSRPGHHSRWLVRVVEMGRENFVNRLVVEKVRYMGTHVCREQTRPQAEIDIEGQHDVSKN